MNKKNLILIGLTLGTVLIVMIILTLGKPKSVPKVETPTATPTLVRIEGATGGFFITPTQLEEKRNKQESKLRLAAPIDTGKFIVDFDWKAVVFTAKAKSPGTENQELKDWMNKNGYELLSLDLFKIIE